MIAANRPVQRPPGAKLLVIDAHRHIRHTDRASWVDLLRPGDIVIANDAAVLPASLRGWHLPAAAPIEIRLAVRRSLAPDDVRHFSAVAFGAGDYRTWTEDRPLPPEFHVGDRLSLGPLRATVEEILNDPRLIQLRFSGSTDEIREGLACHGRPIQYAHMQSPLSLWDVWTPIAGPPVAFEPPSAGFVLDWRTIAAMAERGIRFATITHAAGISSTGDKYLDSLLPFDEPYRISEATARAIRRAREHGGRVVAVGTTVVRALEHAAGWNGFLQAGEGVANQRLSAESRLRLADAILSGTHEPGTSHYELLHAFTDDATLRQANEELNSHEYRTHEFGDSVFIERAA